jgi:hypothetical protein
LKTLCSTITYNLNFELNNELRTNDYFRLKKKYIEQINNN